MKRLSIAAVVLLLLAALIQFPAAWLAPRIAQWTDGRWRLADAQGTLWRGEGTIYVLNRVTGYWSPGSHMKWRVIWAELAKGVIAAQVDFDNSGKAQVSAGMNGWSIERADAVFPVVQMAALLPSALSDYGWSGTLSTRSATFRCTWGRSACAGQVELGWRHAATIQVPGPPLGDYRLRMTAEGQALRFDLGTERGRLMISGSGEISGGKLRFTGEASASGEDGGRLETLLRTIGRPGSAPGRYLIEYQEIPGAR